MTLLAVTVCCFLATPIVRDDPTEGAVIDAIRARGGTVEQFGKVVHLSITEQTDAQFKELAALKNLTTLYLSDTRVTGVGLKELSALKNLTTLKLSDSLLTDAGMKELATLDNLTILDFSATG